MLSSSVYLKASLDPEKNQHSSKSYRKVISEQGGVTFIAMWPCSSPSLLLMRQPPSAHPLPSTFLPHTL